MRGVVAAVGVALLAAAAAQAAPAPPLLGATYTHTALPGCDLGGTGLVVHYGDPGVRQIARSQLAAMHAAGLQTIRILLWNMSDTTGQDWGVVPSAGGALPEPYRTNLIRFASDVKAAGFSVFTVSFSPQWTNNPAGEYGPSGLTADRWDPTKFDENWHFVEDVHRLVTQYGPPVTHFDFLQEGPPSQYQPAYIVDRLENYIATMWQRYVAEFGGRDVTVATIAKGGTGGAQDRLEHLLDALQPLGLGYPTFFEIHPDWTSPAVYDELVAVDQLLRAHGLTTQPIVVGESSYENAAVAADIARFERDTGRQVSEVYEWWSTSETSGCVSAPYRADAYITALTGGPVPPPTPSPLPLVPIPTLTATLAANGRFSFTASNGTPVTALDAGPYRIVIRDRSTRLGFTVSGPSGVVAQTGRHFTGTRVATEDVGLADPYGTTFEYGTGSKLRPFVVH